MSSTHADALARLTTALFLLTGIASCTFEPSGGAPGGGMPDSATPTDGRTPVDGSFLTDGPPSPPIDGPPVDIDANENPQRWKQIKIDRTKVRNPGSGPLANFPVLFSVVDADLAARASTDGSDIHFVAADRTTRLDHEIEKWDKATGQLVAWVKLPSLPASQDTEFYVYYGDPAQTNPEAPTAVWSSSFAAVWHLADRPGTPMVDSTTGNDGTTHNTMQSNDRVPGQIGDAIDFDGVDDEITFNNPITGTTAHTISVWVNQRATNSTDALVVLGNGSTNRARWFYSVYTTDRVAAGFYDNDWDNTGVDIQGEGWTLLHWTYTNRDNILYVNGVQAGTFRAGGGVDTQGTEGRLGNASGAFGPNMGINGQLDEVRIATTVRPAEWIATEFNNQSDPDGFYDIGPESR